jgi:Rho GDP-dissociation inhibitor
VRAHFEQKGFPLIGHGGWQVTVLALELHSTSLPAGKTLAMDITNPAVIEAAKKNPFTIKEGVEYK